ncbi:MAG: FAD-binding oxidoreductase [Candidatus Limnocylindria bacterium]
MTTQRRWNGWGHEDVPARLPATSLTSLAALVGSPTPPTDARLDDVVRAVPRSRLTDRDVAGLPLSADPEDRVRHARGQSLPDWIALRSGRLPAVPDAVARPADAAGVRALFERATNAGWRCVPVGGATNVVGGVTVRPGDRPVVAIDLTGMAGLRALDAASGLATFGAGTLGPAVEAALEPHGLALGHAPQSFEWSSVGGWVATRSSGTSSMGVGRIEALFAGGHLEAPAGPLDLAPFPASAAGPDLRELVLGSEGRLGILTDVIVRARPRPERDFVRAYRLPDWGAALTAGRALARAGLPLRLVRVSTPSETQSMLTMAGDRTGVRWLRRYVRWRGHGPESCLVLVGLAGSSAVVRSVEGEVASIIRAGHGIGLPGVGAAWQRERFRTPYLRNALWEAGYAVDTLETAAPWSAVPALAAALGPALSDGLEPEGERVHPFSHLSHLYPSGSSLYMTYLFRVADDPDRTLERWRRLKTIASRTIVDHGGTISNQHGVGTDHAAYLGAEKGPLGMAALADAVARFDPAGILARGVLLDDDR